MKIGFYLENKGISGVDLRHPEKGNPGIGGTEYNFLTLAVQMTRSYPENYYIVFANDTDLLPNELQTEKVSDCIAAIESAVSSDLDLFIWRPTVRDDAKTLIENFSKYSIDIIIWAHNTPSMEYLEKIANASNVRRFVPVGYEQERLIRDNPAASKTTVISNGFDPSPYEPVGNIAKDRNLVVYTGCLIQTKGFGMLARAWPKVIAKYPDGKLKVIGSGQLYNRTSELGRWGLAARAFEDEHIIPYLSDENGEPIPSVEFMGVMGPEKATALQQALIGIVNPSGRGENCPGSAIEFLAASTAVVSADREGILDVVDHGGTGLLGTGVDALAENILTLLNNPDLAVKLGRAGPASVRRKFNFDSICSKWQSVFLQEVAASTR